MWILLHLIYRLFCPLLFSGPKHTRQEVKSKNIRIQAASRKMAASRNSLFGFVIWEILVEIVYFERVNPILARVM